MPLKLNRWNPGRIKNDRIVLIIGRRGSGKSTMLESILYDIHDRFHLSVSFCPTFNSNVMFRKHIPNAFVFEDCYDTSQLQTILSVMGAQVQEQNGKRVLLVTDDTGFDKRVMNSKQIKELGQNGRQLNLTWISTVQYCKDVPPVIRTQVDYVVCLRDNITSNRKKLYDEYCGVFKTYAHFDSVFSDVTNNYTALVIDQTCTDEDLTKSVFWYKGAQNVPEFKIGKEIFFSLSKSCKKRQKDEMNVGKQVTLCD